MLGSEPRGSHSGEGSGVLPDQKRTHFQQSGTHRAVSLLGHGWLPGEEDELGVVLLQPLHVGLQGLGGLVPPPGVHGDPDSPGKLLVDASELRREQSVSIPQLPPARQGPQQGVQALEEGGQQLRDQQRVSC